MELKDKVKEDNEFVDFNQIVTELLAISSHNINEIPGMHQSKDVPKGIEPSVVKEVARSSVEKKSEVKEAVEQKKEAQVLNFSSYFDLQPEDSDTPKVVPAAYNPGRTDSMNRFSDFLSINSRGNSAFTLLNPIDESGMSRMWNSIGLNFSRTPTIQGDASKLLMLSQQEEEKREEVEAERRRANGAANSIESMVAQKYFANTGMFEIGQNEKANKKN
eukprot:TRINITY_DN4815_c0_g1_i1.p2 TRINITY_DN4815_c0_g1~~TRINITY_DN4815_c0_g1_i1.p2  ORF type:complete len:218 (-),score=64.30 TRINITY_DN4815_c0_g1_i1:124-777(-)